MLNECLNLIGYGAFTREEKPKITRLQIYNELKHMRYLYYISCNNDEDKAMRKANIYAIKNTDKEYYRRIER